MKNIYVVLLLILAAGCTTNPSVREQYSAQRPDGRSITCYKPPPDVISSPSVNTTLSAEAKTEKATAALRGEVKYEEKIEKLRAIANDLQTVETLHFRMCVEYTNGVLTESEYKDFLRALPILKDRLTKQSGHQSRYRKKEAIPAMSAWEETDLGFKVSVSSIGDICLSPCTLQLKAHLGISTATYVMPNYKAVVGFSTAFRHEGKTYKFTVEDITFNPAMVIAVLEEVAYEN